MSFNVTSKTTAEMAANKLSQKLGFKTPKKEVHIMIRFKHGAHTSWLSKKSQMDMVDLAAILIKGFRTNARGGGRSHSTDVPGRPIFSAYMQYYRQDAIELCRKAFKTYSHWSVQDRAKMAGKYIIKDIQQKAYKNSLGLAANRGKYAQRKLSRYGDAPFVATKTLLNNLVVVIV